MRERMVYTGLGAAVGGAFGILAVLMAYNNVEHSDLGLAGYHYSQLNSDVHKAMASHPLATAAGSLAYGALVGYVCGRWEQR